MPKCLVEVEGRSVVAWQLDVLRDVHVVVVVGFRSDDVIAHVRSIRDDVEFVHNHDYANTGTSASLALGAARANPWIVSLDGDLLVAPFDLRMFVSPPTEGNLIGVTPRVSTTAVGALLDPSGAVVDMNFELDEPWEWSGLLRMPRDLVARFGRGHVFESVLPLLPVAGLPIDCVEIDEPQDLARAAAWIRPRVETWGTAWIAK